jgi:uncharacterized protein
MDIFLNRHDEFERLDEVLQTGGLAVVFGRRRVGKTRLLVEWCSRHRGIYFVADESSAETQREYFAQAIAATFPGFGDVAYRDWSSLLLRLAVEIKASKRKIPVVIDELPYLVASSPELPSVLQRFIDHEAKAAKMCVAIAGSSQRMMQGIVLAANAPLFGRAKQILPISPLDIVYATAMDRSLTGSRLLDFYCAFGGVPRYWELAFEQNGTIEEIIDRIVLDPMSPLHEESLRLLLEETPPSMDLKSLLDAVGYGAHRLSEIAARMGRPVTSLARPLERLQSMGFLERIVPFGENETISKKSLYRIPDPFLRFWFRVVGPSRSFLRAAGKNERKQHLAKHFGSLRGEAWEELCRAHIGKVLDSDWLPAKRWWHKSLPEWDVVATSVDGATRLLGECKAYVGKPNIQRVETDLAELRKKLPPILADEGRIRRHQRVLFVPEPIKGVASGDIKIVAFEDMVIASPGSNRPRRR